MSGNVESFLEEIERGFMIALRNQLPTALSELEAEYVAPDQAFFVGVMGLAEVPPTPIPMPGTFIMGHDPLVLERPLEDFPNLATVCYQHPESSAAEEGLDQIDQAQYVFSIAYSEIFSYADDTDTVNRQAKRYARAMHRAFQKEMRIAGAAPNEASLGRIVVREMVSPAVSVSNVVPAVADRDTDRVVYFQGARLSYTFRTLMGPYW